MFLIAFTVGVPWYVMDAAAKKNWVQTRARLAREGESLDLREQLSRPVADEQNFAALPTLIGLATPSDDPNYGAQGERNRQEIKRFLTLPYAPGISSGTQKGRPFDQELLAEAISPVTQEGRTEEEALRVIEHALSVSEPMLKSWAAALDRPYAQWILPGRGEGRDEGYELGELAGQIQLLRRVASRNS